MQAPPQQQQQAPSGYGPMHGDKGEGKGGPPGPYDRPPGDMGKGKVQQSFLFSILILTT